MIADRYYYNQLNEQEKRIYVQFYKGVLNQETQILFPERVSQQSLDKVYQAMTEDNPHLYYLDQRHMKYAFSMFNTKIFPEYLYTKAQINTYNHQIEKQVAEIVTQLDILNATESMKVKKIHDYIAKNIFYDEGARCAINTNPVVAAHSIIGFFMDKKAVCEGIAKAAKILLNAVDVKCIYVSGKGIHEKSENHAWNIVKINGKAYHFDFTWDIMGTQRGYTSYDYYALPDEAIRLDHTDFHDVPACTAWDENYFVRKQVLFSSIKRMKEYISQKVANGERLIYFKMKLEAGASMENIARDATNYALHLVSKDIVSWHVATSCNAEQRIVKLILIPRL